MNKTMLTWILVMATLICLTGGVNASALTTEPPQRSSVVVGSGNQTLRIPLDFYYKSSLFETLYYPLELQNMRGRITSLEFFSNFSTAVPDKPVKVWLGTTSLADLSGGWIPSTELSLVYDGTVSIPAGPDTLTIQLDPPFWYLNQQNLVLLAQRIMDDIEYTSGDKFRAQYSDQDRARKAQSDYTAFDPANPPATSMLSGEFPQTRFTWDPVEVGILQGTVVGTDNWPLQNATIQVLGTQFSTQTNHAGVFSLQLPPGTYSVTAAATGYSPQTIPNVSISSGQTATISFTLISVAADDAVLPGPSTLLLNPHPNPMASETLIRYSLATAGPVKVSVYDIRGRFIRDWVEAKAPAGVSSLLWDGKNERGEAVPGGVYLLRMSAGEYRGAARLILLK